MRRRVFSALLCFLLALSASAHGRDLPRDVPLFPYEDQGPFVIIPAQIPSSLVFQLGFMAGTFLCLPISLAQDARGEENLTRDQEASVICGRSLGVAFGWPVYAAAGLPFYLLKGIFWTGPRAAAAHFRRAPAAEPAR